MLSSKLDAWLPAELSSHEHGRRVFLPALRADKKHRISIRCENKHGTVLTSKLDARVRTYFLAVLAYLRLVVDQLFGIVPAVELSQLCAHLLIGLFGGALAHGHEVGASGLVL